MDEYRLLKKKIKKSEYNNEEKILKEKIMNFISRVLISALIFVLGLIFIKDDNKNKSWIYKNIYQDNITMVKVEKIYKKYVADFLEQKKEKDEILAVSKEGIYYEKIEEKENGVNLITGKDIIIPAFEEGIVLYIGDKDNYKDVLVIKQIDGTETWFVGVATNLKIYDYIEKNEIVGKTINDNLEIYFKQNGESIDYKKYIF